jgi:hypothetical protein
LIAPLFEAKLQIAKCRAQNAKVKMREKDTMACSHPSILQFDSYRVHFALAAAGGRAMKGDTDVQWKRRGN